MKKLPWSLWFIHKYFSALRDIYITVAEECVDENANCGYWSSRGECGRNPGYMHEHCKMSCRVCTETGGTGGEGGGGGGGGGESHIT